MGSKSNFFKIMNDFGHTGFYSARNETINPDKILEHFDKRQSRYTHDEDCTPTEKEQNQI